MNANIVAFLAMVRYSEGTANYPDPYAVTFEGKFTITDFSDHPAVLGDWKGEPLDFLGPEYADKVSTAAGAYQIIRPTWLACRNALSLPDFTAPSQDKAAVYLIKQKGAYGLIVGGALPEAIAACSSLWASLPGSQADQPTAKMAALVNQFTAAGGMQA